MSLYRPEVALAALTAGVRFVVLDVETTPSNDGDRIVSVGLAQVDGHGKPLTGPVEWRCTRRSHREHPNPPAHRR